MTNKFENLFSKTRSVWKRGTVETLCMILVPLMVLLAAGSCEKPETPNEGNNALGYPIDVSFAEYSLTGTSCQWKNLNSNGTVIVINSGEDLENYIDGSYPEIDFSKQTLLLVGGSANNGISQISKSLQQLSGNEYKLDVELTLNDAAVSENWAVSMLVPKITNEVVVTLNVYLYQTTPTLVAKGDKFRGDCPNGVFLQVITTPAEWDTLLSTIPAYSIVADFVETTIDFTAYQVIVVIDEQRYSGGWTIDITDVTEYANSIVVTYTNLMNGNLASVITRPFHIVKIPVSNKQIIFQYEN